jgi:hypothetical protein
LKIKQTSMKKNILILGLVAGFTVAVSAQEQRTPANEGKKQEVKEAPRANPSQTAQPRPVNSTQPAERAQPARPANQTQPAERAQPAQPARPANGAQPAERAQPAQPARPANGAQPAERAQPAQPAKPSHSSGKHHETQKPVKEKAGRPDVEQRREESLKEQKNSPEPTRPSNQPR